MDNSSASEKVAAPPAGSDYAGDSRLMLSSGGNDKNSQLFWDSLDLFRGQRGGHMSKYAYAQPRFENDPAGGIQFWAEAVTNPDMPSNKETQFFSDSHNLNGLAQALDPIKGDITLVELGPGLWPSIERKTLPLIDAFNGQARNGQLKKYIAVDFEDILAQEAAAKMAAHTKLDTKSLSGDFYRLGNVDGIEGTPVALIWGGTLWNAPTLPEVMPRYVLASELRAIGESLTHNTNGQAPYIIFTYYHNETPNFWPEVYTNDGMRKVMGSLLHTMNNHQQISIEPANFDIDFNYDNAKRVLQMNAVSNTRQTISANGLLSKEIEKGDKFTLVNAFRPSPEDIRAIASSADCRVVHHEHDRNLGVGAFVLKFAP